MRHRFILVALSGLLLAPPARAAVLPFTGELSIAIAFLPPIVVTGQGMATVNGSGAAGHLTSVQLGGGEFSTPSQTVAIVDPTAFPIAGIQLRAKNGPGTLALGGILPIGGSANVCLFSACDALPAGNVVVPFTLNGTRGVGIGGGPIKVKGIVNVTVTGSPWVVGPVFIGSLSRAGYAHGPASGGASSAAADSGVLQLVTPVVVDTNLGADGRIPVFATLRILFAPEPGSLLLMALGTLGLGVMGRKRQR